MSSNQYNYSSHSSDDVTGGKDAEDAVAIRVTNLSKCYQIYDTPRDRLKQFVLPRINRALAPLKQLIIRHPSPLTSYYKEFWALKDVSFEVKRGETVGIIGRNGAGKSTLLQMVCGTVSPTYGTIRTIGRIAALLELGSGFNPEFTGQENVYMNGQILGLNKEFIDTKIDDIKSFADIGDFFFQPVKTYSSGMFARLAFSVAVHVDPDILVVDEALSVGDSWFQHKSMARMKSLMSRGCTVIFVSHSIESVRALCQKAIWIEDGLIKSYGDATTITNQYMNEVFVEHNRITIDACCEKKESHDSQLSTDTLVVQSSQDFSQEETAIVEAAQNLDGGSVLQVNFVKLINSKGVVTDKLLQGESFVLEVCIKFLQRINNLSVGFLIKDQFGQELTGESIFNTYRHSLNFRGGESSKFLFSSQMLFRGGQSYSVSLRINQVSKWDRSDNVLIFADDIAAVFDVISDPENPMWFKFKQHFSVEVLHG